MRLSSFGCTKPEHLIQRLQTIIPEMIVVGPSQFANMADVIAAIEDTFVITVFDCHTRQTFVGQNVCCGALGCEHCPPNHTVRLTFRSTVQPKAKARVTVSPETYVAFINDMESSGLWEYEGETPA